jgi:hypothetical protein
VLPIDYRIGDEALPFEDGSFDAVISTVGTCSRPGPTPPRRNWRASAGRAGIAITTWLQDGNVFKMFQVMKRYMPPPPSHATSPFDWGTPTASASYFLSFELKMERAVSYYREPSAEAAWDTRCRLWPNPDAGGIARPGEATHSDRFRRVSRGFTPRSASACRGNTG